MPSIDLSNAAPATPQQVTGVRASPMPPVTWAGLQLSMIVLGAIAILGVIALARVHPEYQSARPLADHAVADPANR